MTESLVERLRRLDKVRDGPPEDYPDDLNELWGAYSDALPELLRLVEAAKLWEAARQEREEVGLRGFPTGAGPRADLVERARNANDALRDALRPLVEPHIESQT